MTYTATGFSNPVRVIFKTIFRPVTIQDSKETIAQHFRTAIKKDTTEVHIADRLLIKPAVFGGRSLAARLARMHSGRVNAYAAYILASLLIVLLIMSAA
jgi:hydrogenase-4 component B